MFSYVNSVCLESGHDSDKIRSSVYSVRSGVELPCPNREAVRPNHQGIKETLPVGCLYIGGRSAAIAAKLRWKSPMCCTTLIFPGKIQGRETLIGETKKVGYSGGQKGGGERAITARNSNFEI